MELKDSMILAIKLKNFKSYRDEAEFSFYALPNSELSGNYAEMTLEGGGEIKALHMVLKMYFLVLNCTYFVIPFYMLRFWCNLLICLRLLYHKWSLISS